MTDHEEMARKIVNFARVHTVSNAQLYDLTLKALQLAHSEGIGMGLKEARDAVFGKAPA